jgi:hypothetical protein
MNCGCCRVVSEGEVIAAISGTVAGGWATVLPGFGSSFEADGFPDPPPGGVISAYAITRVYQQYRTSNNELIGEVDGVQTNGTIDPLQIWLPNEFGGFDQIKAPGDPEIEETGNNPTNDGEFYYVYLHDRWDTGTWTTVSTTTTTETVAIETSGGQTYIDEERLNGGLVYRKVWGPIIGTVDHDAIMQTHAHLEFPVRNLTNDFDCAGVDLGTVLSVHDEVANESVLQTVVMDQQQVTIPLPTTMSEEVDGVSGALNNWGFASRSINHCRKLGAPAIL